MPTIVKDLGLWFWRLVPANPILVRVVQSGGRRKRHLWIRLGYLSIMAIAVVIGIALMQAPGSTGSLAEFAKQATKVFKSVSLIQLGMVCVLAPVFAAAAITQEKDSQTYNILLSTPLTNGQIVLGSLLSRLFFVVALLVASIPLFCIIMVYGGVTGDKIMFAIAIATATALLMGSIAISISVIKIGTGRTIFSFYLAIAVYLMTIYVLGSWSRLIPPESVLAPTGATKMSWLAAFHPFLAMFVVLGETPAPGFADVAHYGFPGKYLLAYPQYSYLVITSITSLVLLSVSFAFVRRSAKEGEPTLLSRIFRGRAMGAGSSANEISDDHSATAADSRKKPPRTVSKNPIAWRESVTSAAAGGGRISRILLVAAGSAIALSLFIAHATGNVTTPEVQQWIFGVVVVEFGITLFVATTAAATSMTREKESNTLELILATPLTSTNVITGKTWGLIWAAGPMLLVPYFTIVLFVLADLFRGRLFDATRAVINPEALLTLPIIFLAFTAFACMIGLKSSIRSKRTMGAVFTSAGIIAAVMAVASTCVYAVKDSGNAFALTSACMPLTPISACHIAISPINALTDGMIGGTQPPLTECRIIALIATICSALIYFFVGWYLRNDMVRSYDMTIRKQMA
ncbi:MAG: ABC transporter permease subunit [Phycisphaerales bacterium]|nr:ABC transporter permease subunit [Phycisphaerales bacterium]MCB9862110.1 ABC transporter permease subunit [Phycisphaerales bacterium]